MENEKSPQEQSDKTLFKSVTISLFWILLVLVCAFVIFEFALRIMSAPSTVGFIVGVVLMAFCVLASVAVIYFELKKVFNKEVIAKTEEKKD